MDYPRKRGTKVKKFKILTMVFIAVLFMPFSAQAEIIDRIIAVINDEIITLSELNQAFETYRKRIEENLKGQERARMLEEARMVMLNRMIDQTLVEQEARKAGFVIKDEEVMEMIRDFISKRNISMEDFLQNLARDGTDIEAYKKEMRDHLARMRLVGRAIKSKITISEEEIGDYYRKNKNLYEGKETVRIKQIVLLFPRNVNTETKEKLKADMDTLRSRIMNGEPFELLAANFSQGPEAASGGDIGFIERGGIFPAIENAAFSLNKDEISTIIESPIGFHIIKVVDRRGAGTKSIESVRAEIREKIEEEKMQQRYAEWIKELRNKAHIEIKI